MVMNNGLRAAFVAPLIGLVLATVAAGAGEDDRTLLARLDDLLAADKAAAVVELARRQLAAEAVAPADIWRVRQRLAVALLALDEPLSAVAELETALIAAPADAALHLNLGRALWRLDKRGRAVAEFEQAVDLAPREFLWRLEYAEALLAMGIEREALRQVRLARSSCADCPQALRAEANVHLQREDAAAGREVLDLLYALDRRPEIRHRLAWAHWNVGDAEAVVALLDTVTVAQLTGSEVMILIQADRRLARTERAIAWVRHEPPLLADGWRPEHSFWAILSEICLDGRFLGEALTAIERALAMKPATAVYHHNHAAVLQRLGRHTEAQAALARAGRLAADRSEEP